MRKSWIIPSLCALVWMVGIGSVAAEEHDMSMSGDMNMSAAIHQQVKSDMKLELNGEPLQLDESYLIDNSLFVPYRAFAEGIGAEVSYEASTQTVTVKKEGNLVQLTIGSSEALVNGSGRMMVGPAQLINSSTFVHSRFLAEVFGIAVQYDEATRTVNLVSDTEISAMHPIAKTYYVDIEGFQFKGGNITVEAGSTIVFTNKDKVKHNAVAVNGSFKLPLLGTGESGGITLTEPGEYAYFCEPHKNAMQGVITVK
ncbi:stalk domain-containing protein [Paenibacillus roseipurpureus]|uniref:Stalk domain-containing protein n=1 Tax=Paenibacillus roseopurpureus TaxID=2918901 RepID=A0AA96RNG1_9BACL|nr:stalk domain-containing protein [Paenibacillus sp. MBLB1832]WNR45427.1 stalk domain-containing protein [Paenibacillus sp. MBLB1832]